jgi:ketosteroid isomerase-like protein
MKNKISKGILLSWVVLFIIACNPKKMDLLSDSEVDPEKIKAEIEAIEAKMAEMYNLRSAASEEYYAEDAISFSQNRPPLVGKFAIDKSLKDDLTSFNKGDKISFSANEIFPSNDGEQVVEIGSYKVVDSTNNTIFRGNYMSLFVKREGKYVCIRDMGASDMPEPTKK